MLLLLQYVLVTVDSGKPVMFASTEEPAAFGELFSIGAIGGDKNKEVIPWISRHLRGLCPLLPSHATQTLGCTAALLRCSTACYIAAKVLAAE